MYKLLMNTGFGKTCEKQHESGHYFTTPKEFENEIYDDQTLIY